MKPRYYSGNALIIGGNRFVGKALASEIGWAHRYNTVDVFNRSGTGHCRCGIWVYTKN